MRPPTGSGKAAQDAPVFDVVKLLNDIETGAAPDSVIEGHPSAMPLVLIDQQEELAVDIFDLVAELKLELGRYLAFRISGSSDETVRLDTESAIEWVEQTIGDLVATIVGVEEKSNRSADPLAS